MAVQMTVTLISTRFPGTSIHLAGYIAFDRIRSAAAQTRRAKMPFTISPLSSVPVTTPLNGSQFHELLQPLHGVHHHSVDSGDRWPGGRPLCPPASKRCRAHSEVLRSFNIADVPLLTFCLRLRYSAKLSGHSASNLLDELLLRQSGEGRTLLTKDAYE